MRDRDHQPRNGPGFSRRDFLKGSGAAVAATAMATATHESSAAEDQEQSNVVPAKPVDVTLNVNGQDHQLTVEPRVTLMDALRNDLNLTGCKYADDSTATGTDTVIIDGKAALASAVLAIEAEGKAIWTVESLKDGDQVDEVIEGFVKHDAQQCGFCTPGFVMAVRAFLNTKPKAELDEINKGLGGNICRCGTYHGITQCALEIARKGGA